MLSIVRMVTTVFAGTVTVTGCGGGGAAGAAAAAGAGSVADAASRLLVGDDARLGFAGRAADSGAGVAAGTASSGAAACVATTVICSLTLVTPLASVAILYAASRAASSGTWPVRVTTPPLLDTSTAAFLSAGSENIFALMSMVIASSLGAPRREHETLNVSANNKARTLILFLRISSSALAARSVGKAEGNPKWCVCRLQGRANPLTSIMDAADPPSAASLDCAGSMRGMQCDVPTNLAMNRLAQKKREALAERLPEVTPGTEV